ncbi:M48 family peptidase [Legionella jordanis]|uniref:M48 family metallopeptidase n=1 Tax=Legionella jordanis TaxID=456 RepID=UPI000F0036B9|nr:SprT family zinc-dependent metalloprotease [Legionella jordanis]RMX17950.1 M48 family peptidase [Legionella jordanis]
MSKYEIELDNLVIEVIKKPIKHLHLRVYPPDGKVKVSAPLRYRLETIRQLLESKLPWIHSRREHLIAKEPKFTSGECIEFLGKALILCIEEHKRFHLAVEGNILHFYTKSSSTNKEKQQILLNWYRKEMKSLLPVLIEKWEAIINVKLGSWGIKLMKTRWGSCNIGAKRIWLNLSLIRRPLSCMEYVLVHEMVHLLEKNHNKRFYALMDHFMPDWRKQKILLEAR